MRQAYQHGWRKGYKWAANRAVNTPSLDWLFPLKATCAMSVARYWWITTPRNRRERVMRIGMMRGARAFAYQ